MKMFRWLDTRLPATKYDLASSGMQPPHTDELAALLHDHADSFDYGDAMVQFSKTLAGMYGLREENIIAVNGGTEAILLASWFLGSRCGSLFVPVPEYEPFIDVPSSLGIGVIQAPVEEVRTRTRNGDGVMLTSPNNPSGTLRDQGALNEVILDRPGIYKYVSETYSDFVSMDRVRTIFQGEQNMICSNTLTKFYGLSSLRLGWIFADPENIQVIQQVKNKVSHAVSIFSLVAATNALKNREHYSEVTKRRILANRKILADFLSGIGIDGYEPAMHSSSVFLGYSSRLRSQDFCTMLLEKTGVLTMPGEYMGVDNHFRLGYTAPSDILEEGLRLMGEFMAKESVSLSLWSE